MGFHELSRIQEKTNLSSTNINNFIITKSPKILAKLNCKFFSLSLYISLT